MRRGMDAEVFIENDKLYGFNLGADFTAEHEWGIERLKSMFGVTNTRKKLLGGEKLLLGVKARTITEVPINSLHYNEIVLRNKKYFYLICFQNYFNMTEKITVDMLKNFELYPYREDRHIFTAWDEDSFGILVDETYKNELTELYEAFNRKDIVLGLGKGHVFKNSGLLLIVRSSMTKEEVDELYAMDLDAVNLQKAAEQTGIIKLLKAADKRYYALSPKWKDDTKTEVVFWLNPVEQNLYNYGWFGVEELKQWIDNEGPIMMRKEDRGNE